MKLCTFNLADGLCGEPSEGSRCEQHPHEQHNKPSREARGYDHSWRKLSQRARELQPWCSKCGATEDLTCDHLEWPARTLAQVDVLCRACNAAKGKPTAENDPRGKTLDRVAPHPRGKAFSSTLFDNASQEGGVLHGQSGC